jgi:hypothetical protein
VSVPFKADLSVWDKSDYSDPSCGGFPVLFLTMEGDGYNPPWENDNSDDIL